MKKSLEYYCNARRSTSQANTGVNDCADQGTKNITVPDAVYIYNIHFLPYYHQFFLLILAPE